MDIKDILPLLLSLSGGGNDKLAALISALGGNKHDSDSTQNGKDSMSPLFETLTKEALHSRERKQKAEGLTPILGFASDDIIGKITRYFAR